MTPSQLTPEQEALLEKSFLFAKYAEQKMREVAEFSEAMSAPIQARIQSDRSNRPQSSSPERLSSQTTNHN